MRTEFWFEIVRSGVIGVECNSGKQQENKQGSPTVPSQAIDNA
jgi:hypothetical protein